jgi:hypothetical protein
MRGENLMYEDVDKILYRRAVPEAPYGLSERIIAASLRLETVRQQNGKITLHDLWDAFRDMFVIPQPAYALALAMMIGLTIGVTGQAQAFFDDTPADEVAASFALADDVIDNGASL